LSASRCRPHYGPDRLAALHQDGLTLVELVVVISLIAVIGTLAIRRLDTVSAWKQRSDIRKFAATWEFLHREAQRRGDAFRLIIDLDKETYTVRQEIPILRGQTKDVDYLKNMRLESERRRIEESQTSEQDAYKYREELEGRPLDEQYFHVIFEDPYGTVRQTVPLDHPRLADTHEFASDLSFRDVVMAGQRTDSGQAVIRFSPRGASDFAVVHLWRSGEPMTVMMNPSTGQMLIENREVDFDWLAGSGTS
jgi:prepilin-type N-terminal cleavage/methylation domain-containing protein